MNQQPKTAPAVFEYLDVARFLYDYYSFRKAYEERFSFETWAAELGFKSRSYLRMAVIGKKKISLQFTQRFVQANHYSEKQKAYFEALVQYSQASGQSEKKKSGNDLILILKTCVERVVVTEAIEFLSNPLYARLLVLIGFEDINPTVGTYSRLLDISEPETLSALNTLVNLKLAYRTTVDKEIQWRTSNLNFDVPDNIGSVPIMRFHEASLQDSITAFHQPKNLRRYKSLIVPLTESELIDFNALIEDFATTQLARFRSNDYKGRRLFQVNLNIFSVSKSLAEADAEITAFTEPVQIRQN